MAAAEIAAVGLATFPFNSHPVTLDQEVAGLLASIAHRLALAVWAGGLPALIMLIGVGPIPDDTRRTDTYLTTDIPYAATSIATGLKHYEDNCTGCHGVGGHGDGPLASSLPVKPADLSAPHTALHTGGDLYWWVTHGITNSPMPAFADVLTDDERWDIINFLGAFSVGYQGRVIEPKVQPGQYWLAPPDFEAIDETGNTNLLSDYRQKSAVLVVLFPCVAHEQSNMAARHRFLHDAVFGSTTGRAFIWIALIFAGVLYPRPMWSWATICEPLPPRFAPSPRLRVLEAGSSRR